MASSVATQFSNVHIVGINVRANHECAVKDKWYQVNSNVIYPLMLA